MRAATAGSAPTHGVELERFFHLDDEDRRLIRTVPIDPPPGAIAD